MVGASSSALDWWRAIAFPFVNDSQGLVFWDLGKPAVHCRPVPVMDALILPTSLYTDKHF